MATIKLFDFENQNPLSRLLEERWSERGNKIW